MGSSAVFFGPMGLSDHCPAILFSGLVIPKIHKPFQFFNFMHNVDGFVHTLRSVWDCSVVGDPIYVLSKKLQRAKKAICELNRNLGNVSNQVVQARQQLNQVQLALNEQPGDRVLLQLQRESSSNLWDAWIREEALLKQKSRVLWLKEGDSNSSFFHSMVKSRWNINKILSIENANGELVHGHDQAQTVAVDYFYDLLGSPPSSGYGGLHDWSHIFSRFINPSQALMLDREVTDDEIWNTLKSMKKNKSPGPDGFNVNFFILNWDIVGQDFLAAIKSFFSHGFPLKATNATTIALIPKVPNLHGRF